MDYMKSIPDLAPSVKTKKRKPKFMAVVDEDNCTGCQVCIPFCPVDCIEPVPKEKYNIPINFIDWVIFIAPLSIILLIFLWLYFSFRIRNDDKRVNQSSIKMLLIS